MTKTLPLAGLAILVAEDEYLTALDLSDTLEAAGAEVTLTNSVVEAVDLAEVEFDAALLDIALADGDVYPIAEMLKAKGIPIAFHSGRTRKAGLDDRYPGAPVVAKPSLPQTLIAAIGEAIAPSRKAS